MPLPIDPDYWRTRADSARRIAATFTDGVARTAMLEIAKSYDLIAERAERQAKKLEDPP